MTPDQTLACQSANVLGRSAAARLLSGSPVGRSFRSICLVHLSILVSTFLLDGLAFHTKFACPSLAPPYRPSVGSAWNSNGTTWEEKDVQTVGKKLLETAVLRFCVADDSLGMSGRATKIDKCKVHQCSVVNSRGRLRVGFDVHLRFSFEVTRAGAGAASTVHRGTVDIEELCDDCWRELECSVTCTDTAAKGFVRRMMSSSFSALVGEWKDSLARLEW